MVKKGSFEIKVGLAEMLKGGVIMDVMNAEQAKQAEQAGAAAVTIFLLSTSLFAGSSSAPHLEGGDLSILWVIPFAAILGFDGP